MPLSIVAAIVALLVCLGSPALAETRVALVIGNSAYKENAALNNTRNDAADLAAALRRLDFDVMQGVDLDKRSMERLIRDFDRKLGGADIALFFYAGHGLQVAGQNYLVPTDARLTTEGDIDFESVPLGLVLKRMEREAKTSIVLLDACRDNPLARNLARRLGTRSAYIGQGLSRVEAGIGTLIGFSTQPGNYALDGDGRNSPYTRALLDEIEQPGREMLATLAAVRGKVVKVTGGKQVPWEHTSLLGPVVLKAAPEPDPKSSGAGAQSYVGEAARTWEVIQNLEDISVFEAFRRQFGASSAVYDQLAASKIAKLKQGQELAARKIDDDQKRAKAEQERLALKAEEDKKRAQVELERLAAVKAEEEKKRAQAERERLATVQAEEEKKRAKAEADRLAAAKAEDDKKRAQAERERLAALQAEEEKKRAKAAQDRLAAVKAEEEKKRAKAEDERLAAVKAEEDRKRAKVEADRLAAAQKAEEDKKQLRAERQRVAVLQADEAHTPAEQKRKSDEDAGRRDPALAVEPGSGKTFRDRLADGQPCPACPELVMLPEGEFLMGSTPAEIAEVSEERPDLAKYFNWEAPQRKVRIGQRFAAGRTHVTRGEFTAFVAATGHKTEAGCYVHDGGEWKLDAARTWRAPGFEQTDRHPVVCVSWADAKAYADWLAKLTGRPYRLLSEAEAEYAVRATPRPTQMPRYSFGNDPMDLCAYGNGANRTAIRTLGWDQEQVAPCEGGYVHTAPVASFKANAWGLHDVHGNAWSWTADCWNDSLAKASGDGAARTSGDCTRRVVRGGSWANGPRDLRSAVRDSNAVGDRSGNLGFRVARGLSP